MKLLTTKQLAEHLQVNAETIYRWRKAGMPHHRIGPKTMRYDLEEVLAWKQSQGTPEAGNGA